MSEENSYHPRKFVITLAVEGDTREELASNLVDFAKDFAKHHWVKLERDNCCGSMPSGENGDGENFDFDYDVFPRKDIVTVGYERENNCPECGHQWTE